MWTLEIATFNPASSPTKLLKADRVIPNLRHVFDTVSFKDHVIHITPSRLHVLARLYLLVGSLSIISPQFTDQFEIVTFYAALSPTKLLKTDRVIPNLRHVFDTVSFKDHVVHVIGSY